MPGVVSECLLFDSAVQGSCCYVLTFSANNRFLQAAIRVALAFMVASTVIESLSSLCNNFGVVTRLLGRWSWTWLMVNLHVFRMLVYLSLPASRIFQVRPTKTLDVCSPSCSVVCHIDALLL